MKNLDYALSTFEDTLDHRLSHRLAMFVPYDKLSIIGIKLNQEYDNADKWNNEIIKPFTRENILAQLKEDVSFGFEKALDRRGLSAGMMFDVVWFWNYVLEEGLENWDKDNYTQYGLPLFKATAEKYGWDNPIGDDNGDEDKYSEK